MLEGSQLYLSHWKKEWWEFSNDLPQLQEAFDKMFVVDGLSLTRDYFVTATVMELILTHYLNVKRRSAVQLQCQFQDIILMVLENWI
jgi:hypothetical protein